MARLNPQPAASSDTESQPPASSSPSHETPDTSETPLSPAHSIGSDKENRGPQSRSSAASKEKRKGSTALMAENSAAESSNANKRRKVSWTEPQSPGSSRTQQYYDPDQNPEERRTVRKGLRSLFAKLNDSKSEYLRPDSHGLEQTLREADELYKNVKQTSEATIDSRLLVQAADLSFKKINNLSLGDGTSGIDVDDFVTKCIGFMKRGDEPEQRRSNEPPSTQTQRRRRRQGGDLEEGGDEGDTMNWEYLGRNACFLYNSRPSLTGFLLGPLSVQKKVRQQTQRKAREARSQATQAVRPVELNEEDLQKQESASLTQICTEIARVLQHSLDEGARNVEREWEEEEEHLSEDQIREILRRNRISENGCVPLFDFCVNPRSFGQTVENLFYVSFLIKEGKVGLDFDKYGLPTLGIAGERTVAERQETKRNQAVFTLDFDVWEDIIQTFGIEDSIIPHRDTEKYDDGILDYARPENDNVRQLEAAAEDSDMYS